MMKAAFGLVLLFWIHSSQTLRCYQCQSESVKIEHHIPGIPGFQAKNPNNSSNEHDLCIHSEDFGDDIFCNNSCYKVILNNNCKFL